MNIIVRYIYSKTAFNQDPASRQEQATLFFANRNHGGVCRREREACLFHSEDMLLLDNNYHVCRTALVLDMRFSRLASMSLILRSSSS